MCPGPQAGVRVPAPHPTGVFWYLLTLGPAPPGTPGTPGTQWSWSCTVQVALIHHCIDHRAVSGPIHSLILGRDVRQEMGPEDLGSQGPDPSPI